MDKQLSPTANTLQNKSKPVASSQDNSQKCVQVPLKKSSLESEAGVSEDDLDTITTRTPRVTRQISSTLATPEKQFSKDLIIKDNQSDVSQTMDKQLTMSDPKNISILKKQLRPTVDSFSTSPKAKIIQLSKPVIISKSNRRKKCSSFFRKTLSRFFAQV